MLPTTPAATPKGFEFDARVPRAHYQRAASIVGHLRIGSREVDIDGFGVRNRTWGFRDESVNLRETIGFFWVFPTYAISAMRLIGADGPDTILGYRMCEDSVDDVRAYL